MLVCIDQYNLQYFSRLKRIFGSSETPHKKTGPSPPPPPSRFDILAAVKIEFMVLWVVVPCSVVVAGTTLHGTTTQKYMSTIIIIIIIMCPATRSFNLFLTSAPYPLYADISSASLSVV
jgi:hypothetical protein